MLRTILLALLLSSVLMQLHGQTLTSSNLPIVVITTPQGQTIQDDPRITCHMGVINNGTGNMNNITDPYNNYDGDIFIEIRGSTSQQYPKKGYGFETQDSLGNNNPIALLGMPVEHDWILYGPYPDKTLIRNVMTYEFARQMGNYAPATRYCELVIDGDYRGVYVAMERIKIDGDRVDIQKLHIPNTWLDTLTGGYILKVDKLTGEVGYTWESLYDNEVVFQFHDPEFDELNSMQVSYMENYIGDFEAAVNGPNFDDLTGGWRDYIEDKTFHDFFILQELGRTVDGYRSSSFLHKDKNTITWNAKLRAGPMWDFNLSYGNADYCLAETTTGWQYKFDEVCNFTTAIPFWWERLLDSPGYTNALRCRWEELRQGILSTTNVNNYIDSLANVLQSARIRNFQRWPIIGQYVNWNGFVGQTYQEDVDYLKTWMEQRSLWIDANMPGECNLALEETELEPSYHTAWPNPFDQGISVGFSLFGAGDVEISVLDLSGRLVEQQTLSNLTSGTHATTFETGNWVNGAYLYVISLDGNKLYTGKIVKQ